MGHRRALQSGSSARSTASHMRPHSSCAIPDDYEYAHRAGTRGSARVRVILRHEENGCALVSIRFSPTPASSIAHRSPSRRWRAGPIPERNRIAGDSTLPRREHALASRRCSCRRRARTDAVRPAGARARFDAPRCPARSSSSRGPSGERQVVSAVDNANAVVRFMGIAPMPDVSARSSLRPKDPLRVDRRRGTLAASATVRAAPAHHGDGALRAVVLAAKSWSASKRHRTRNMCGHDHSSPAMAARAGSRRGYRDGKRSVTADPPPVLRPIRILIDAQATNYASSPTP